VALVAAILLPLLLGSGALIWRYAKAERVRQHQDAQALALELVGDVDRELDGTILALRALATSPALQAGDLAAFDAQARAVVTFRGESIVLRDAGGRQVVNTELPVGTPLPATGSAERGALDIALGLMADRKQDYEEAFRYISAGKKLRADAQPFDAEGQRRSLEETIQASSARFSASTEQEGSADDSPIFIIGMPRSGTTLLERILSGHSQIEAAGELPVLPRLDEHLRKESAIPYGELIASMSAARRKVVRTCRRRGRPPGR